MNTIPRNKYIVKSTTKLLLNLQYFDAITELKIISYKWKIGIVDINMAGVLCTYRHTQTTDLLRLKSTTQTYQPEYK